MGQHKYNPTAILAKEGKLPPKPKKLSAAETRRELRGMVWAALAQKAPGVAALAAALSVKSYGGIDDV